MSVSTNPNVLSIKHMAFGVKDAKTALEAYSKFLDVPTDTDVPPRRSTASRGSGSSSRPAHSYLSVVDGPPMRHATWADCERRVKGRSGARFKKAMSASDEAEILRGWKIDPGSL